MSRLVVFKGRVKVRVFIHYENNNCIQQHLTTTAPIHSGIAGHVVSSKIMYVLEDNGFDPYLNPLV
jgi:hypothetical protein